MGFIDEKPQTDTDACVWMCGRIESGHANASGGRRNKNLVGRIWFYQDVSDLHDPA